MLRTGKDYLERIRDGRRVLIGSERVGDVTRHPAFAAAARMYAALYDLKADPAKRELMSFEENGERFSMYFLKPKSREDLVRRTACHKAIADFSHGLLGRSPDHVAASFTGLAMRPEVFDSGRAARNRKFSARHALLRTLPEGRPVPRLRDPAAPGRAQPNSTRARTASRRRCA